MNKQSIISPHAMGHVASSFKPNEDSQIYHMEASTRLGDDELMSPHMRSMGETDPLSPGGHYNLMHNAIKSQESQTRGNRLYHVTNTAGTSQQIEWR